MSNLFAMSRNLFIKGSIEIFALFLVTPVNITLTGFLLYLY